MAAQGDSLETQAPPEKVWRIWSDTSTWPAWNPDVEAVSLDGPFAAGVKGTMRTKSGGEHHISIAELQPGRSFVLESDGVPATRLLFKCEILPAGAGSRISQSVSLKGPFSFLFGPMMGKRIASSFPPLLDGLAAAAERE
jgi:hypothetical protein